MALTFFDPSVDKLAEFKPARPPAVGVERRNPRRPRERETAAVLEDALRFLGLAPEPGAELRVGGDEPGPGAWLKVAPLEGGLAARELAPEGLARRGLEPADFRYLCLGAHYRRPLAATWEALAGARDRRLGLVASARSLQGLSLEPSPRAYAGYLQRFRDALSKDLDTPGALECVWDALRPGALSPGSKGALLRAALPALGLDPGT